MKKVRWLCMAMMLLVFFTGCSGEPAKHSSAPDFSSPSSHASDAAPRSVEAPLAASAGIGEKLVAVMLPSNAADESAWNYTEMSGTGKVSISTSEAYEEYIKERDNTEIVDFVIPGYTPFIFEGAAAGDITLKFSYSDPSKSNEKPMMMQVVSMTVYEDNTLSITQSYSVATDRTLVAVILPFDANSGGEWTYTAEGVGEVSEASWEEYAAQELAMHGDESTEDEDIISLPDEIPTGSVAFVFRGTQAGMVELVFTCSEPATEEAVTIEVFPDLTLAIIWPEQK